jgi:hypothetical protein
MTTAALECHTLVEQLFIGPYATSSPKYIQTLEHAAIPLIYSQVIVAFSLFYAIHNPLPFVPGGPVTMTIRCFGPHMHGMGYTFYGMVLRVVRICTLLVTWTCNGHPKRSQMGEDQRKWQ